MGGFARRTRHHLCEFAWRGERQCAGMSFASNELLLVDAPQVDVLFGHVNPSAKLPYTVGKRLEDYGKGAQILYFPNAVIPQQNFTDGLYIDYRHFDKVKALLRQSAAVANSCRLILSLDTNLDTVFRIPTSSCLISLQSW